MGAHRPTLNFKPIISCFVEKMLGDFLTRLAKLHHYLASLKILERLIPYERKYVFFAKSRFWCVLTLIRIFVVSEPKFIKFLCATRMKKES